MRKGGVPVPKNMYTVAGDGPCNEELSLRIQAGDKNAAERLISQNEGYLTGLARAYTPWCETEDLKQEAALALLDAAGHFDPTHGTKLLTYATPVMEAAMMRLRRTVFFLFVHSRQPVQSTAQGGIPLCGGM